MKHLTFWPNSDNTCGDLGWLEMLFPKDEYRWHIDFVAPEARQSQTVIIVNAWCGNSTKYTIGELNQQVSQWQKIQIVSIGDEHGLWHWRSITHPNAIIWVQFPKPNRHDDLRWLPAGPLSQYIMLSKYQDIIDDKDLDWSFSGMEKSPEWMQAMKALPAVNSFYSADLLAAEDYYRLLARTKVVPCRPTDFGPETARIYDALEAGCVPIVGVYPAHPWWRWATPPIDWPRYWTGLFGENPPFPVISDPAFLGEAVRNTLSKWPEIGAQVSDWWKKHKISLHAKLNQ